MDKKALESNDFNSLNIIQFIYLWRKQLAIIGVVAFIISSLVALNIPDKFKATVILFPATTNSISKALLTENPNKQDDILQFGKEEDAEQMLQILKSDEVRTRICEKYDLMKHYEIDSTDRLKRTKLYDKYMENITFLPTEYISVKIEVLDIDPEISASIANEIANLHDSTKIHIQHNRAKDALRIVENEYRNKEADVNSMTDSIKVLNTLGIYDYESQSEVTSEQYAIAISKGDQRAVKSLEEKLKIIAEYGSAYVSLRDNLELQRKQLNLLKTKYEEAMVDANQILPQKFIVSGAYPAEEKSYPVRWLIVLISVFSSLLIALIAIILFENIMHNIPKQS